MVRRALLTAGVLTAGLTFLAQGAGAICAPGVRTYWACVTTSTECTVTIACDEYYCSDHSPTGRSREKHVNLC